MKYFEAAENERVRAPMLGSWIVMPSRPTERKTTKWPSPRGGWLASRLFKCFEFYPYRTCPEAEVVRESHNCSKGGAFQREAKFLAHAVEVYVMTVEARYHYDACQSAFRSLG